MHRSGSGRLRPGPYAEVACLVPEGHPISRRVERWVAVGAERVGVASNHPTRLGAEGRDPVQLDRVISADRYDSTENVRKGKWRHCSYDRSKEPCRPAGHRPAVNQKLDCAIARCRPSEHGPPTNGDYGFSVGIEPTGCSLYIRDLENTFCFPAGGLPYPDPGRFQSPAHQPLAIWREIQRPDDALAFKPTELDWLAAVTGKETSLPAGFPLVTDCQ